MNDKKVSVIITTYKGETTIERAINSIRLQTYKNIEIIIVDDNDPSSKHRTLTEQKIINLNYSNLVYVKHEKNMNGAVARNTGLKQATGEFICYLDDDDVYLRERISESVRALENNKDAEIVFCDVLHFSENNSVTLWEMSKEHLTPKGILLYEAAIGTGSNLFLYKAVAQSINGFDEVFLRNQDLEFAIRALSVAKPVILHKILIVKHYNETDNQANYQKLKMVKERYNKKFEDLINSLTKDEKRRYLYNCYYNLFSTASRTGNKNDVLGSIKIFKKQGFKCSFKMKLLAFLSITKMNHLWIYRTLIEMRNDLNKEKKSYDLLSVSSETKDEVQRLFSLDIMA